MNEASGFRRPILKGLTIMKRNQYLSLFFAIILVLAMATACNSGGGETTTVATSAATTQATTAAETAAQETTAAAGATTSETQAAASSDDIPYNDPNAPYIRLLISDSNMAAREELNPLYGWSDDDNGYTRYIYEQIGLRIYMDRQPSADYTTKVQLVLTANDGTYDLINGLPTPFDIARSGALLNLNPYLENAQQEYPNLYAAYWGHDFDYWGMSMFDENRFLLPGHYTYGNTQSMLIRTDWLEKLGLPMPTSVAMLKETARAFIEAQPDGNDPTFGLSGRDNLAYLTYNINAAYGNPSVNAQVPYTYIDKEKREVATWNISDGARAFYIEMQSWWDEGLINKEALTNKGADWWNEAYQGKMGIICHQTISTGWLTSSIRETISNKDATLQMIPWFEDTGYTNQYGNTRMESPNLIGGYSGVPRGSTSKVDLMLKYVDFLTSTPGMYLGNIGLEGLNYSWNPDGTMTYIENNHYRWEYGNNITHGNPDLMDDNIWGRIIWEYAGGEETEWDSPAEGKARLELNMDYDQAHPRPFPQTWSGTLPKMPSEDMYPDWQGQMTELWVMMIQGIYDASTDGGWESYLRAVSDTGYLTLLDEQTAYIRENRPELFD